MSISSPIVKSSQELTELLLSIRKHEWQGSRETIPAPREHRNQPEILQKCVTEVETKAYEIKGHAVKNRI